MEKTEKPTDVKEEIKEYKEVNVVTSQEPAIQTPQGEVISVQQAVIQILNKLDEIKKFIG